MPEPLGIACVYRGDRGNLRSWLGFSDHALADSFLWLTCFLCIFPGSKAIRHLLPHSWFSVVAAERWREANLKSRGQGFLAFPGHSGLGVQCWFSSLTLGEGRRWGTPRRINNSQTSWVLSPLGKDGAHSPRMLCHQTGERAWEILPLFHYGDGRGTDNYTRDLQKGEGWGSFSIKI